jgi:hypothetical protein
LRSILRQASGPHGTNMRRIEELATAALERWSNPSGELLEPDKAEEPPEASGRVVRALGR